MMNDYFAHIDANTEMVFCVAFRGISYNLIRARNVRRVAFYSYVINRSNQLREIRHYWQMFANIMMNSDSMEWCKIRGIPMIV